MVFSCVACPELVTIVIGEKAMHFFSKVTITGESEGIK